MWAAHCTGGTWWLPRNIHPTNPYDFLFLPQDKGSYMARYWTFHSLLGNKLDFRLG